MLEKAERKRSREGLDIWQIDADLKCTKSDYISAKIEILIQSILSCLKLARESFLAYFDSCYRLYDRSLPKGTKLSTTLAKRRIASMKKLTALIGTYNAHVGLLVTLDSSRAVNYRYY